MSVYEQIQEPEALLSASTVVLGGIATYLKYKNTQLKNKLREAIDKSGKDPLTDLPNRRVLENSFAGIRDAAVVRNRNTDPSPDTKHCLAVFDLDKFKEANDTYGHKYGDDILRGVAATMRRLTRDRDVPVRFGGDEFALLLPRCGIDIGTVVAQDLLGSITRSNTVGVTASIGIVEVDFSERNAEGNLLSLQDYLERADQAMYAAKDAGRNTVVRYDQLD